MARPGVQKEQVFAAADDLVEEGVKPTVEKIRHHLGTGSPNTISPMLDEWFKGLAKRLRDRPPRSDVDDLPPSALNAFRHTWKTALQEADAEAARRLEADRAALREQFAQLVVSQEQVAREAAALARREEVLKESLRLVQEQAGDLRRQVEDLTARGVQLHEQLEQSHLRIAQLEVDLRESQHAVSVLRQQGDQQARAHADERARDAERAAATERHHLLEIDRARTEAGQAKSALQETQNTNRTLGERVEGLRASLESRTGELARIQKELAEEAAHCAAAEEARAAAERLAAANEERVKATQAYAAAAEARVKDLTDALTAQRQTTDDLRQQVADLHAAADKADAEHAPKRGRTNT